MQATTRTLITDRNRAERRLVAIARAIEAHRNEQRLDLTPKEFALLRYFMLHPSEVLTPERLLEHVWDDRADPFTNTVRVTVSNLRRKLAETGSGQPIETVVGVGYRLAEGVE